MVTIVKADPEVHANAIRELIKELDDYEKVPGSKLTAEQLKTDLLQGRCHSLVALNEEKTVIGYTIYHYAYSSCSGAFLSMEDLYVTEKYRKKGIGKSFFSQLAAIAQEEKLSRIGWSVLRTNLNAIGFSKKIGGIDISETEGFLAFALECDNVEKLVYGK